MLTAFESVYDVVLLHSTLCLISTRFCYTENNRNRKYKINYRSDRGLVSPKRKVLTCQLLSAVSEEGQFSGWYQSGTTAAPVVIGKFLLIKIIFHIN